LLFFVALPILIIIHFWSLKYTKRKALNFANFEVMEKLVGKKLMNKNFSLLFVRLLTLSLFILAAAGTTYWFTGEGSDFNYVILVDGSVSMLAEDYFPNRISAAKEAALVFLESFSGGTDIAVATFTGTTFIKQKMTDDKNKLRSAVKSLNVEEIGGSAIGDAMVTSSNLLFEEDKDNVLIILTDGQNNAGIHPEDAIPFLNDKKILVNTVGIGTPIGGKFIEGIDAVSKLDETTLINIAKDTGGRYFRAENSEEMEEAFKRIAQTKTKRISKDLALIFMIIGVMLLLVEWGLMNTKYRSIP
jgi:Ca-activated chloride channel homolog